MARARTRSEAIADADRARSRGQVKKAVAGYRKALESDPADASVNLKLAPLLAKLGDAACFRTAARRHAEQGFTDRAAAVNTAAIAILPLEPVFRMELARLNVARGRRVDALETLLEGAKALTRARRPEPAASLLRTALEIEPWHPAAALALVPILTKLGHGLDARRLLLGLDERHRGRMLRRIRWVAFRTWPGPGSFLRWLRAK